MDFLSIIALNYTLILKIYTQHNLSCFMYNSSFEKCIHVVITATSKIQNSSPQGDTIAYQSEWLASKRQEITSVGKDVG